MGKGEIARYEQFLLFSQCFQEALRQTRKNQGLFGKELKCWLPAIPPFPSMFLKPEMFRLLKLGNLL